MATDRERCKCGTYSKPGGFPPEDKGKCFTCDVIWQTIYGTLAHNAELYASLTEQELEVIHAKLRAETKERNAERARKGNITAKRNAIKAALAQ